MSIRKTAPASSFRILLMLYGLFLVSNACFAERLPIRTYTTVDGLAYNVINKIVRDSRGFLWFCTADGLSRFDGYTFTNYGTDKGLPQREVTDFLETREGKYWVATNAGLVRFNPKAPPEHRVIYANEANLRTLPMFTVIVPEDEDRYTKAVTTLLEDRNGAIWCGTYKGLFRLEGEEGHLALRPVNIGIPQDWGEGWNISDLLEGKDGSLWVAAPSGLYRRWPDGSAAHYEKRDGLPDNYLHDLFEDHEGQLWAGTRYGGFFRFVADDTHKPPVVAACYATREGMPIPWVFQLFETSDRRFWIASGRGLLQFFPNRDEQGRWFHPYTQRNGLSYSEITAVNEDAGGNLWLGTNTAGAMKLARQGFITYDQRDGLHSINSIFEDRSGAVCFRGIVFGDEHTSVFEGAKLDPLGHTQDYLYTRLGKFDGQRFTWFTPSAIADLGWVAEGVTLQARNGEWWLGTAHGLYRFPPADSFDQIKAARPLAVYTINNTDNQPFRLFEDSRGNVWISSISSTPLVLWSRDSENIRDLSSTPGLSTDYKMAHSYAEDHAGNVWIGLNGQIARYHNGSFTVFGASDGLPPGLITSIYSDHAGRLWLASARSGLIRVDDPEAERPDFVCYSTAQGLSSNSTETSSDRLIVEDLQGHIYIGTGRGLDRLDPLTGHFRHFTTADGLASGSFRACLRDRYGGLWFGMTGGLSHFVPAADEQPEAPPPSWRAPIRIGPLKLVLVVQHFSWRKAQADEVNLQVVLICGEIREDDVCFAERRNKLA